jgi:hypothetical protein
MKKFTILIAAVALVCFAAPAMAVDWNFYGNARMATFWTSVDIDDNAGPGEQSEDQDLVWDLQGNSRFGANVKAENISAQVEMGIGESNVSARRVYGVWNFGAGKLKVGKDYTPTSQFISGQVFDGDLGLLGTGTNYGGRHGQITFSFGNFDIALVNPESGLLGGMTTTTSVIASKTGQSGNLTDTFTVASDPNGDVDEILPKLEVGWGMGFDSWNFNLMGGAQYYSISDVEAADGSGSDDLSVTSYIVGGDVGWNFGPGYLKAAVSYGQNVGNAAWGAGGTGTYGGQGGVAQWDGDDDTNDTYTGQAALVGGLKISDMFSFEAGAGIRNDATDSGADKDSAPWAVYLQSVIALAPGVYIIPEVGYYDYSNNADADDAGSSFYLGGKWQINF